MLQPENRIDRISDHGVVHLLFETNIPNHDFAGMDADPHLDGGAVV